MESSGEWNEGRAHRKRPRRSASPGEARQSRHDDDYRQRREARRPSADHGHRSRRDAQHRRSTQDGISPELSDQTSTPPQQTSRFSTHSRPNDSPSRRRHRSPSPSRPRKRSRRSSPPPALPAAGPSASDAASSALPYHARALSRWDFAAFAPLFAHYLDLQKQLRLADLSEHEARGRWKSFAGKWNRGELAEGWYEPAMFLRVVRAAALAGAADPVVAPGVGLGISLGDAAPFPTPPLSGRSAADSGIAMTDDDSGPAADDDDDGWGPALPGAGGAAARQGPAIPGLRDLDERREADEAERQARAAGLRLERRADRAEQRERLDELAPRAEAGSRERRLEARREAAAAARAFREASPGGGGAEPGDAELLGDGAADGAADYKRMLASMQRRRTEREVRRDEARRARDEERDERIREYRKKEEGTVDMLRELARQRFG